MDPCNTLFVRGWRCGWKDILKISSLYLNWTYMNGYCSILLQRGGRKILKPTCSSGRHLAEGLPKNPKLFNSRVCVVSTPGSSACDMDSSTLWCTVRVRGTNTWNMHWIKRLESTDCPRRKVPPFLPKQAPAPPRMQRIWKNNTQGVTLSSLGGCSHLLLFYNSLSPLLLSLWWEQWFFVGGGRQRGNWAV